MRQYIAIVREVSITGQLEVSFPDLPGCAAGGNTMAEAKQNAAEELTLHLESMIADGIRPPKPSTLSEIMANPDNHNGEAIVVAVEA